MMCNDCRGVIMIESSSSVNSSSVGIEIPIFGCKRCHSEGYRLLQEARGSKNFVTVQFIDRVNRVYERYGK
jgi:hypothetical protein